MNQPLAFIHPQAKIANNVVIEPFAVIHKNVEIGEGTWIGSHVTIMEGARIGKNVKIYPGAVISGPPQDLKYEGEETFCYIGDNTTIREFATINRGTKDRWETRVGKNCLLMAYVHVAHDCVIGDNCILANVVQLAGHVIVEDYAILGGGTVIHQFTKIGAHSILAGGSLVNKDIPPYTKAARYPISYCGINSVGLRRRGYSNEKINEIQDIYRVLYLRGLNNSAAARKIELEFPATSERDEILNFIRNSKVGIMSGVRKNRFSE
jgi:UDP-N-acetylglucosamine acyltransferase